MSYWIFKSERTGCKLRTLKTDQYIRDLYQKFLSNKIEPAELQELFDCLNDITDQQRLKSLINETLSSDNVPIPEQQLAELAIDVKQKLRDTLQPEPARKSYWKFYAAVAAAIALMAIGVSYYLHKERLFFFFREDKFKVAQQDIQPGGNKAILTLSSGQRIELDDKKEALYQESGIEIRQEKDGSVAYVLKNTQKGKASGMNRIEVPKGGQYKVILPDGTKVWLNSVSTLRYPAAFGTVSRTMEMTGEAFFAIAPNKNFPFKVIASGQEVTALGTSFNINAYANEPNITTTLVEGKLKVEDIKVDKAVIIYPGQQTVSRNGKMTVSAVNTADVTAWKEGLFVINNSSLAGVMRQIERWYDVTVDVEIPAGTGTYSGELPKNIGMSELLTSLEAVTGVKLKLEGRRITTKE